MCDFPWHVSAGIACMKTSFFLDPEDYAAWLNARVGEELRRRRGTRSAYELAIPRRLSDQTILNIERCVHSATITSLGLVCARLRIRASELVLSAEGGGW
jgi:hypothetical protein